MSLGTEELFEMIYDSEPNRRLKYQGGCTIPLFQLSVWSEKCVAARRYADIGKQLSFLNNRVG
jgi:hypothetical protein